MRTSLLSFFRKHAIASGILALCFVLAGFLVVWFRPTAALGYRVDRGPVRLEIKGTGTLEGVQEVPVAFRVGGRVQELAMAEGALVREGQILGRLDPSEAQSQLEVALASQSLSRTGVVRAQAEVEHAAATQTRAQADLARAHSLFAQGILSRSALDAAVEQAQVATAQTKAYLGAQRQSFDSVRVAQASTAVQQRNRDETLLRAPMDGLLVKRLREPGHVVTAGSPIYTLVSTKKIWIRVWVDETALGFLAPGQEAQVEFRSTPGRFHAGRVDRVGRKVDHQTHELLVDIELLELPPRFAVGQRADAIIRPGTETALRVLRSDCPEAGAPLWVEREGRAVPVQARLGRAGEDYVEVLEGLQEGDRVLRPRTPGHSFQPLERVTIQEERP